MTKGNRNLKDEAKRIQRSTGVKYTEALRVARGGDITIDAPFVDTFLRVFRQSPAVAGRMIYRVYESISTPGVRFSSGMDEVTAAMVAAARDRDGVEHAMGKVRHDPLNLGGSLSLENAVDGHVLADTGLEHWQQSSTHCLHSALRAFPST